ncbi:unnamed protein product [Caenorhabditis angaria]|uniref:Uncharacterized protein n=1 Tax=Caenorhabditis angaria TaxID=860376 RepID=A0A9P1N690_9PELO|nr:unnamed protein product [Caenorhabditis angaria]
MDEDYHHPTGYYPNRQIYYSTPAYTYRNPYYINRPYIEEDPPYFSDYYPKLFGKNYAQIFIAGILLVTDVSKIVLLWNYVQLSATKMEMLAQIIFPLFSLIIGFTCLTSVLNPSKTFTKFVSILLLIIIVPNFVFPKYSIFMTNAIESVEISQIMDRNSMVKGMDQKMSKILQFSTARWPLGVTDLSSLPQDFVLMMQYMLIAYSIFSLSLFIFYIITLFCFVRFYTVQ